MSSSPSGPTSTPTRSYHVVSKLGRGGFGTVYRAELRGEGGFTKQVALKVLNPDMEAVDEFAMRMRDEARVLGLVRHRAIVQVDGLVRLNGRWTVVMELVDGADFKRLVRQEGPIPPGPALEMMGEIAGALHAAWTCPGKGGKPLAILHRDVKPSNLHLTALGEVKVLDFGIARADFESREAQTRSLSFGSPEYMAPERFDLLDCPAGDVYSMGSVLYELLTGEMLGRTSVNPKKHGEGVDRAMERILEATRSDDLAEFVAWMLAYDHDRRPSAREVERQCALLRSRWPSPLLRDWAERVVPGLLSTRTELPPDDLTGSTLYEATGDGRLVVMESLRRSRDSGAALQAVPNPPSQDAPPEDERPTEWVLSDPNEPSAEPPSKGDSHGSQPAGASSDDAAPASRPLEATDSRPGRWWIPVGLAAALGVLVMGGRHLWGDPPSPDPPPAEPAVPEAPSPDPPAPDPAPAEEPPGGDPPADPDPSPPEPVVEAPDPAPSSAGNTPSAPPPDPTPDPPMATVSATGDATRVVLIGDDGEHALPAEVPPGTYRIRADFPKRGEVGAGEIRVVAGATTTLRCQEMFGRCAQQ